MLKTLAQVDWSNIQHCFGPATDFPAMVNLLTSDDPYIRFHAHLYFEDWLNHQNEICETTFYAVPVLIELLEKKDIPDRDWIVGQLFGFVSGALLRLRENGAWGKEVYEAIYQRRDFIKGLLKDFDGAVRIAAAHLLCSFEDKSHTPVSWIKDHIAVEEDLLVKAELAYVLANYIGRHELNDDKFYIATFEVLEDLINETRAPAVRFKAAVNILRLREKDTNNNVIEIIVELLSNKHTNAQIFEDKASISQAFVNLKYEIGGERAVKALTTILENVDHPDHIYEATNSLLGTVFDRYYAEPLTPLQKKVLEILARNDKIWKVDPAINLMTGIYKLPETQSELVTLLDSASLSD